MIGAVGIGILIALAVGLLVAVGQAVRADRDREKAEAALAETEQAADHWFEQAQAQAKRAKDLALSVELLTAELNRIEQNAERSLRLVVDELETQR